MATRRPPPPPPRRPPPLPPRRSARHGSDEIGRTYEDRARADQQRRMRKRLLVVGLPLAILITGLMLFVANNDPAAPYGADRDKPAKPLNTRAAAFPEGWNASEFRAIEPLIAGTERDKLKRLLRKVVRRRHWEDAFPEASAPTLTEHDATHWYADYALQGYGSLRASWVWENDDWWIVRLSLKKAP